MSFFSRRRSPYIKYLLLFFVIFIIAVPLFLWEPHVEFAFYSRGWVQREVETVRPLASCFDPQNISPRYNVSQSIYGPKTTEVHAGMPLRLGMDCYNFAGTVLPLNRTSSQEWIRPEDRTQYHSYWRSDLITFGERQEWMLKSFFSTQHVESSRFILWTNDDVKVKDNDIIKKWLKAYPDSFMVAKVNYNDLALGTALEGSSLLNVKDTKAWIDGDLVRLLVLWVYGGVWVDMDSLLTRDLGPLLEHEFVTQWDCYDKKYVPFNGALMSFKQHSPYLCEAFHIMENSPAPRQGTTDWGATLYLKMWRRLVSAQIPPFKILPWCFTDGRSCRLDNRLPDPFTEDPYSGAWTSGLGREENGGLDKALGQVFSVHLHNQWTKNFPKDGWVDRLLLQRYDSKLKSNWKRSEDEL
ncbi:glycosyltransferase family 32 protein [Abortiporus biennis]|nr:glycosyltransferase family 32 protein [Abortiporus biennis]